MNETYDQVAAEAAERRKQDASVNEVLRVRVGSHLYGTATSDSDEDMYSVWVPSLEDRIGLYNIEQFIEKDKDASGKTLREVTHYPLHLFIRHVGKCNPNMLEAMYAPDEHIMLETQVGGVLRRNVDSFLSRRTCHQTFFGYADSQKKKLTHKLDRITSFVECLQKAQEWLKQGREKTPEVLTAKSDTNADGWWKSWNHGSVTQAVLDDIVGLLEEYGWRKELIVKYGFDVKFAANLIRILSEGVDLFTNGRITFPLVAQQEIRDVRNGKHKLMEVLQMADYWEFLLHEAWSASEMQEDADYRAVHDLLVNLQTMHWNL